MHNKCGHSIVKVFVSKNDSEKVCYLIYFKNLRAVNQHSQSEPLGQSPLGVKLGCAYQLVNPKFTLIARGIATQL